VKLIQVWNLNSEFDNIDKMNKNQQRILLIPIATEEINILKDGGILFCHTKKNLKESMLKLTAEIKVA